MQASYLFDSIKSRDPHGAVCTGTQVVIRVSLLRTALHSPSIWLRYEAQSREMTLPLVWEKLDCGYDVYSCVVDTADATGLIWCRITALDFAGGCVNVGETFQITVYAPGYETPEWYAKGVTYHAFVDRFCRGGAPLVSDPDYIVHQSVEETPVFLPDENGIVRNNDIYGGNLQGIIEKLDYLNSLGVRTIYLSPIFEAWSNHKYNTADYHRIDPHFGNESDLEELCSRAKEYGMRVILDGVFNHTGSDSVYFNREGRYDSVGAFQSETSPYRQWYSFFEGGYESWWGIDTLPSINEQTPSYLDFIIENECSVIAKWMQCGISGWRLDVADELPDEFLAALRHRVRKLNQDAVVIGEVWEDASNKIAYSKRRPYFTEHELDGVMNYPLKDGILAFLNGGIGGIELGRNLEVLLDHYPKESQRCLMNLIGTHDTARALTVLGSPQHLYADKAFKAEFRMSEAERALAIKKLKLAVCLQYVFPGSPSIYYGDEVGMEGFEDPLNRRFYPWGKEDRELLKFYQMMGKIKCEQESLHNGKFCVLCAEHDFIMIKRGIVILAVNRGEACDVVLPEGAYINLFDGDVLRDMVHLPKLGFIWLSEMKEEIE
ncbi:MAG: glycoside hydrolase family 13 protein [Oscillospiraceae bacterium]|nr:glycoside hydrolase family 13 protein [Oscillospiraceae bacterium]